MGTVQDWYRREFMDSLLCSRLFGRYFIATGSCLEAGKTYSRRWWRQEEEEQDSPPNRVELFVTQTQAADVYYSNCGLSDQHNRSSQDTLMFDD